MIVESRIKVLSNHAADAISADCIGRLRSLCDMLIDDEVLGEQIAIAAQAQAGLGRDSVDDRIMRWARCLVIKDCIAAAKLGTSTAPDPPVVALQTKQNDIRFGASADVMQVQVTSLGFRLRKLALLQRFVFVLRAIEGYSRHQTSVLLDLTEAQCDAAYLGAIEALGKGLCIPKLCQVIRLGVDTVAAGRSLAFRDSGTQAGWDLPVEL